MDKTCTKCQTLKNINEFALDKTHSDGHRSLCKTCISGYMKSYLDTNNDAINKARMQRYYENLEHERLQNRKNREKNGWKYKIKDRENHRTNPIKRMVAAAKIRAKRKNLEFDISEKDLTLPTICPVLGIPLHVSMNGNACDNSPTLDRIDNSKGYTKDNTVIVSFKANTIKNTATTEELEKVLQYYKHHEILR